MENETLSKRKVQSAETKKRIYEAAHQLMIDHGIENVSVDSIVKAAEVSKGTFYVHFESKDALVAAIINDYTNMADMDYKTFLMTISDHESTLDILVLLAEKISDFIDSSIGVESMRILYKGHLSKTINTTTATTTAIDYNRELYKLFTTVLERGIHKGELREDLSVEHLARHLILAIRGITFEWCIRYPDFDLKEQVRDHFKILLYGLKREK